MKRIKLAQIALVLTCLCVASCSVSGPKQSSYNNKQPLYQTNSYQTNSENGIVRGSFHDDNNLNQNLLVYTYY